VIPARMQAGAIRAVVLASGGHGIGRTAAQQLARRELAKVLYRPSLTQRVGNAIVSFIGRLLNNADEAFPGGWWALIALITLAVLVTAAVIFWIRPSRTQIAARALLQGPRHSADDHRRAAERLAAAGDYATAIIESLRAIAVELEERGVLPPRAGRTADELAAEAAAPLPGQASELAAAARLFDDVRYGGRPGSPAGYQQLRELDTRIRAARGAGQVLQQAGAAAGPPT